MVLLAFLKQQYHVVTPQQCFSDELDASRINILLTFDDGYASWIDVCLPILSSLDIKALFFISSGLLDAYDDAAERTRYVKEQLLVSPRETLSWDGLRILHRAGHTIGGHTMHHARLSELPEVEQRTEITCDKERIEAMLRATITAFAYPFGEFTPSAEEFVRDAGYKHAFSTEARFANFTESPIPRLCVEEAMSAVVLKRWIEGGYDVHSTIKRLVRSARGASDGKPRRSL